jgi:glutamyl-Q tRNA(Asp) synthetase
VVAALGSWLDARAHCGRWLVRIEDVDAPRCPVGADRFILSQLAALGLQPDEPPVWQSQRASLYGAALARLVAHGQAFACACTRKDLLLAQGERPRHGELIYPGTCRQGLQGRPARAWRLRVPAGQQTWVDRCMGAQAQDVAHCVGDFVLKRADGLWAYQLAVVVDDAEQGITDVVRGADLADNTPRQRVLQALLGLPSPRYLHLPLVLAADGQKLSKQNGAQAISMDHPLQTLQAAAAMLGLPVLTATTATDWLAQAVSAWAGQNLTL